MARTYVENREFRDRTFSGAVIRDMEFADCVFVNCSAVDCRFVNCSFLECDFRSCRAVNPRGDNAFLRGAVFSKCSLVNVDWAEFRDDNLYVEPVDRIRDSFLKYCSFYSMDLAKQQFRGNELQECSFRECRLSEADFSSCDLNGTVFQNCDLRRADFRSASGYGIDTVSNKLRDARFSYPEVLSLLAGLGIRLD